MMMFRLRAGFVRAQSQIDGTVIARATLGASQPRALEMLKSLYCTFDFSRAQRRDERYLVYTCII